MGKALATKSEDLCLIPWILRVERETLKSCPLTSLHMSDMACTHTYAYARIHKMYKDHPSLISKYTIKLPILKESSIGTWPNGK